MYWLCLMYFYNKSTSGTSITHDANYIQSAITGGKISDYMQQNTCKHF